MSGDKWCDLDGVEVEAKRTSHFGLMKAAVASPVYPSYVKDILDFSAKHLELKVVPLRAP